MRTQTLQIALIVTLALLAGGCAVAPSGAPIPGPEAPPTEDRRVPPPVPDSRGPGEPPASRAPPPPPPAGGGRYSPPAEALVQAYNAAARGGDLDGASASLERALRIEPRNPWLWHRLALVRLFQHRYREAEGLALRSNAYGRGLRALQRDNWRLVAQAREAAGDRAGAEQAAARARRLE